MPHICFGSQSSLSSSNTSASTPHSTTVSAGGKSVGEQHNEKHGKKPRKKSLLIGINYVGSENELGGCHDDVDNMREFLSLMGYPEDRQSQVIMRDDNQTDPQGPLWPNGHNMQAAMQWLVAEPNTMNFLHYSGHGSQVRSEHHRASGFDDTVVPVDFLENGMIASGILHNTLVSHLPPKSSLFIVFDCCHSGSAVELPYVYRADVDGNVSALNNMQAGMHLVGAASHLIEGGFTVDRVNNAESLLAGATSFFKGLVHQQGIDRYGLEDSDTSDEHVSDGRKDVCMYSGCRDDQTSADATINGSHVGAMSWAFLTTMKEHGHDQSYLQVLQNTRQILKGEYEQIPQLSVGYEQDLNHKIRV